MSQTSSAALRRQREKLLSQLPPLQAVMRGSLIERYSRCGKGGCHCAEGKGHGPKYYLSVSFPGERPRMDYVPQELAPLVRAYLNNLQQAREILEQICEINRELLRRREEL